MVRASRPIRTTMGKSASTRLGGRGERDGASASAPADGWERWAMLHLLGAVVTLRAARERAHERQGRHDLGSTSLRVSSLAIACFLDWVANQRAGHAVPAAAALAQLEALDGDDLDAGLAHLGDGVGVALISDHHARLEGDDVVAVVPLLALLLVGIA